MTGWTECPNCRLKHTARPDGRCPRCRLPLSAAAPAQPEILPTVLAPPPADPPGPAAAPLPAVFPAPSPTVPAAPAGGAGWRDRADPAPGRRLAVGPLVSESFSTWSRNAGSIVPLVLLANVPPILAIVWAFARFAEEPRGDRLIASGAYWVAMGINLLINPIELFGVARAGVRRLAGAPVRFGELVGASARSYLPALAAWVLLMLAVVGTSCTVVMPFILLSAWAAALPAISEEGSGPIEALRRSASLTKGHRWVILGAIVVLYLVVGTVGWTFKAALGAVAHRGSPISGLTAGILEGVSLTVQSIGSSVVTTFTAVAYLRLREAREGSDVSHLKRVFE